MKYFNFKRFKFSTIFKNINFKRYERILANVAEFVIFIIEYVFSSIYKSFNFIRHYFLKTYNNIDFKKYNFDVVLVKNLATGPCAAIKEGLYYGKSDCVIVYPVDDFLNINIIFLQSFILTTTM